MSPLPFAVSFKKQMFMDIHYPVLNSRSVFVCKYKGRVEKNIPISFRMLVPVCNICMVFASRRLRWARYVM